MTDRVGLVDVHAHFLTPGYVEAAKAAGHDRPDGMPGWPSWSPTQHLELMDANGIASAMLSISSPGVHFGDDAAARTLARQVNTYGAEVTQRYPTRFGHFAALPLPDVDGSLTELAYALDVLGANGVAVETNHAGTYLGDPVLEPVWEELDRRRATVFVHPTSPPNACDFDLGLPRPMLEFYFESARAVTSLLTEGALQRHSRIRWIITHCGGALPVLADRIEAFQRLSGGAQDAPGAREQLRQLWFDTAGFPFPTQLPTLVGVVGDGHVLYGSDYCWTPTAGVTGQIAQIDDAARTDGQSWRTVTTANARRLFPKDSVAWSVLE